MNRRDALAEWFPVVLKYTGLIMMVLGAVFWAATYLLTGEGVVEPSLLAAFGSMIGIGEGAAAMRDLAASRPQPEDYRSRIEARRSNIRELE